MTRLIFSFILLLFIFSSAAFPQADGINLLRGLLDLPAPPPVAETEDEIEEKPERPEEFYKKENAPPVDAPIEDLIDFWTRQNHITASHPEKIKPDEKILQRLIESLEDKPENLTNFLALIPSNQKTAEIVKNIFDLHSANFDEDWRKTVGGWLKYNSKYYSDELFAEARTARDHKSYGSVIKEKELRALAKVDWEKAESLLRQLERDSGNPRTALFAKRLIYEHAIKEKDDSEIEKYRSEFQKIVGDKNASGRERDDALEALFRNEDWQGSLEWYLSLFEDETLLKLELGQSTNTLPLNSLVGGNPDKWIPIIAKLVGNKNRAVHNAAVQALVQFRNRQARKDALEPLLPWISNPDWAKDHSMGRLRLIQSMSNIDLPESVLPLIWAVENDKNYAHWAADSLVKYKDPRAVPALKIGLENTRREDDRTHFYRALIAGGGFTIDEMMSAIEIYAEKISTPEGYKEVEAIYSFSYGEVLPLPVSIGKYLANQKEPDERLILRAIERQKILQKEKPETARVLSGIMQKWQGRLVDLEMLRKISVGKADVETIVGALARRRELKERVLTEVYAMRGKAGLPGAIAACLSEDENEILSAFRSSDAETQASALACARLLRASLPVNEVGNYLSDQNKLLALAAERYLESEDSSEARRLILAKYPGQAFILGARDSFNPANVSVAGYDSPLQKLFASVNGSYISGHSSEFDKTENLLRREILEDENLKDIFAFGAHFIRVYADKAVYRWNLDEARFRERVLTKEELAMFHRGIIEKDIYNRPPVRGYCHHDCGESEFLILNRSGGRRLYMFTAVYELMPYYELFENLQKTDAKLHYRLSEKLKGLEVLLADEKYNPKAIWKNGEDFRVLVEDNVRKVEIKQSVEQLNETDYENEELDYKEKEKRRFDRKTQTEFEAFQWRKFENGKLTEIISEPAEVPFLRDKLTFPAIKDLSSNESVWQARSGNYEIRAGQYGKGGLWQVNQSQEIERREGNYAFPITSGNWVVAAKTDGSWGIPNYVVRVNLQTGKEYKIDIQPADNFNPVSFVPAHNKVLLYRAKDDYGYGKKENNPSPETPEYYLLDAATGKTELVKGEFRPLIQQTFRPLQPTGKPFEFWAAIYDRSKNRTEIGRYNAKNFSFKAVLIVPEISLSSMNIWVDEPEAKVYFIYQGNYSLEGHLLSLPLPKSE